MIREFIERLKKRSKEISEIPIGKIGSPIRKYSPSYLLASGERARLFTDHLADNINSNRICRGAR
jgi:hypothetical protein